MHRLENAIKDYVEQYFTLERSQELVVRYVDMYREAYNQLDESGKLAFINTLKSCTGGRGKYAASTL